MCGLLAAPLRDQWEDHTFNEITNTPATYYPFGHVVGLAAPDMVQPCLGWHRLVICKLDGCPVIFPYVAFVMMLQAKLVCCTHSILRPCRVGSLWIDPRLALAAT